MRWLLALLLTLIFAASAYAKPKSCNCRCVMPIAIDEVIAGVASYGASSQTISKVYASSPTVITVQFYLIDGASTKVPSSVTYGGQPITISSYSLLPTQPDRVLYYGALLNPPSGAQNLVINYTGSAEAWYLVTFWTGGVGSVSWTTRAADYASPVVNIAKAATSAVVSFMQDQDYFGEIAFIGPGTAREIWPPASGTGVYAATQEPVQGTGSIDWNDIGGPYNTAHVSAEIIAAAVPDSGASPFQILGGY